MKLQQKQDPSPCWADIFLMREKCCVTSQESDWASAPEKIRPFTWVSEHWFPSSQYQYSTQREYPKMLLYGSAASISSPSDRNMIKMTILVHTGPNSWSWGQSVWPSLVSAIPAVKKKPLEEMLMDIMVLRIVLVLIETVMDSVGLQVYKVGLTTKDLLYRVCVGCWMVNWTP